MSIGVVSKRSVPPLGGDRTIGRTVRPEPEFAKTKSSTSVGRRSAARAGRFSIGAAAAPAGQAAGNTSVSRRAPRGRESRSGPDRGRSWARIAAGAGRLSGRPGQTSPGDSTWTDPRQVPGSRHRLGRRDDLGKQEARP